MVVQDLNARGRQAVEIFSLSKLDGDYFTLGQS